MKPEAIDLLQAGIRAAAARQSVIANNIANVNTPGFHRGVVRFEDQLAKAIKEGDATALKELEPEILRTAADANAEGNSVNLDEEVGEMVKNSTMHKAYFRLLNKILRQIDLAIGAQ